MFPARDLIPVAADIPDEQAASLVINPASAILMLLSPVVGDVIGCAVAHLAVHQLPTLRASTGQHEPADQPRSEQGEFLRDHCPGTAAGCRR